MINTAEQSEGTERLKCTLNKAKQCNAYLPLRVKQFA